MDEQNHYHLQGQTTQEYSWSLFAVCSAVARLETSPYLAQSRASYVLLRTQAIALSEAEAVRHWIVMSGHDYSDYVRLILDLGFTPVDQRWYAERFTLKRHRASQLISVPIAVGS